MDVITYPCWDFKLNHVSKMRYRSQSSSWHSLSVGFGKKRHTAYTTSTAKLDWCHAIQHELDSSGKCLGYKLMWWRIQKMRMHVFQNVVQKASLVLYFEGLIGLSLTNKSIGIVAKYQDYNLEDVIYEKSPKLDETKKWTLWQNACRVTMSCMLTRAPEGYYW